MKRRMKKLRSLKDSNYMVSEIVGTVLLLGVAVTVFSTLYASVFSHPSPSFEPNITLVGTIEGSNIIIEHRSGEALGLDTEIKISNDELPHIAGDYLDEKSKEDGVWNIGERVSIPFTYNIAETQAEIMVIDKHSNSLLLIGTLDITPECDLGIKYTINTQLSNPQFNITLTAYRGDINEIHAKTYIKLPGGWFSKYHTTTKGNYTPGTGIWDVDSITVGEAVTLTIDVAPGSPGSTDGFAEIIYSSILDTNPENNKAYVSPI